MIDNIPLCVHDLDPVLPGPALPDLAFLVLNLRPSYLPLTLRNMNRKY
jgi:hypothetical protein